MRLQLSCLRCSASLAKDITKKWGCQLSTNTTDKLGVNRLSLRNLSGAFRPLTAQLRYTNCAKFTQWLHAHKLGIVQVHHAGWLVLPAPCGPGGGVSACALSRGAARAPPLRCAEKASIAWPVAAPAWPPTKPATALQANTASASAHHHQWGASDRHIAWQVVGCQTACSSRHINPKQDKRNQRARKCTDAWQVVPCYCSGRLQGAPLWRMQHSTDAALARSHCAISNIAHPRCIMRPCCRCVLTWFRHGNELLRRGDAKGDADGARGYRVHWNKVHVAARRYRLRPRPLLLGCTLLLLRFVTRVGWGGSLMVLKTKQPVGYVGKASGCK